MLDMNLDEAEENSSDEDDDTDELDPLAAERMRRAKKRDFLRRTAGEPVKPDVYELSKLQSGFLTLLRLVLAD